MRNMTINSIMHRLQIFSTRANPKRELTTITVGMTADSAVMPTVIVVLSLISSASWAPALIVIVYNLFRRKKKGHKWPKLKIFSAPKAENMKKMAQICCL